MKINILVTLNKAYLPYLISMIRSLNDSNPYEFDIYVFSNDISLFDINKYNKFLSNNNKYYIINIPKEKLNHAPITYRYPQEMYYRILASKYLPQKIDKILYLDPDIIIKGDILDLYNIDLTDKFFAGASNIQKILKRFNQIKNGASRKSEYINTGVLLMNLKELRLHQNEEEIYEYIEKRKHLLTLPDQDIINALYGEKIIVINRYIYNLSDRAITQHNLTKLNEEPIDLKWVDKNTKIIHYLGKNKPWKEDYHGILKVYYDKYDVSKIDI